ncbi:PucR family transcriptional regulator [Nocardia asteroides]|uniref:PucR family transcriptional regulator n=1 Tax=Nocardia asteroides TaxID=1824 RepID=UPI0037C8D69D
MLTIDENLCAPVYSEDNSAAAVLNEFAISLLSGGHVNLSIARHFQIPTTNTFVVVAVSFSARPDAAKTHPAATIPETRLNEIRRYLAAQCGFPVPALLGPSCGTILIPGACVVARRIGDLPALLSAIARESTTAVAVESATASLPAAADIAHELLDLAICLHKEPRLYVLGELALEYQITRPGPGRDHLVSLLEPLEKHPELIQTLAALIQQGFDRKRSARRLCVHPNTIDYRMRRISALTGLPATHASHWRLFAAYTARTFVRAEHAQHRGAGAR